jgi:hypothetical protein
MRLGHAKQAHFFRPVKRGRGVHISCPIWTRGLPTMIVCGRWGTTAHYAALGHGQANPRQYKALRLLWAFIRELDMGSGRAKEAPRASRAVIAGSGVSMLISAATCRR